jgi:large subunit ribosomal protein L10
MAITKQKKGEIVEKVRGIASKAKTIVFANFKGLDVASQNEMRKALRAQNIGYTIAKKTLLRLGLEVGKFSGTAPALEGEVAIAYGEDELAPAREMAVFVKKFSEQLMFAGGIFGGKYVNKAEIASIAAIPGLETLRAQFVQLINSPRQRLVVVFNARAEQNK